MKKFELGIRERNIEGKLRDLVRKKGGRAYKFESPGNDGVPDRLVIMPGGRITFVETKSPHGKLTALQKKQIKLLKELGCRVLVLNSMEAVESFIKVEDLL